ncbi:probable E3 ubiquitin-protein ligase RHY1A [Prosopis cineraria]|uniref:probable E3 ubiquitin-protein ligase RHY1A n=1 Tax=Prosopis cineraria TaxID=364024 RepID=UPI00240F5B28|nr:probable E3 ubiquitin-protein ligase RHY1A [Prosopis cineraria]
MTSASELFYNRRYRLGRTPNYLGDDSLPDRYLHLDINNRRHHHNPHDFSDGETLRRSTPTRRLFHRLSYTEQESARLDLRHNRSLSNTANSAEDVSSFRGPRVNGNDRLPIAVVHARARLLQRLSAAPPSRNRQRGRISLDIDDMRHTNFRDEESSESSTSRLAEGFPLTDLTLQMERSQLLQEVNKKPPGLNQEAMDRLHMEVFSIRETQTEELESRVLQDCGICLETFLDGDKLIRLPCGHRFHSACLDPWVRKCGDCPFCRRGIFLN